MSSTTEQPVSAPVRSATIEVTIEIELTEPDLFPDGVPDQWDAAAVVAEIQKSGDAKGFLNEWDMLAFGCHVDVQAGVTSAQCNLR